MGEEGGVAFPLAPPPIAPHLVVAHYVARGSLWVGRGAHYVARGEWGGSLYGNEGVNRKEQWLCMWQGMWRGGGSLSSKASLWSNCFFFKVHYLARKPQHV